MCVKKPHSLAAGEARLPRREAAALPQRLVPLPHHVNLACQLSNSGMSTSDVNSATPVCQLGPACQIEDSASATGDAIPLCKVTAVILHGVVSPEAAALPQRLVPRPQHVNLRQASHVNLCTATSACQLSPACQLEDSASATGTATPPCQDRESSLLTTYWSKST